jgi:hypothetical protein
MKNMQITIVIAVVLVMCLVVGCAQNAKSESHSAVVRAALVRLLSRPSGAFVIIEDARTGKFVQFAGSKEGTLLLDLPSQTLSPDEMTKAKAVFADLGYPGPETYEAQKFPGGPPAGEQTSFIVKFGKDVDKATALAVAILDRVYALDENAKLKLTEE